MISLTRRTFCAVLATTAAPGLLKAAPPVATVFAAASLRGALDEVIARSGSDARLVFAGSAAIARQVAAGAPADIVISASTEWMDWLVAQGAVIPGSVVALLSNRLALVAHQWRLPEVPVTAQSVADRVGDGRIAMALVDAVPAGVYGKAALETLGLWDALSGQVVQSDNVRSALALVARGEAPFGIVYATDAALSEDVGIIGLFSENSHSKIVYPAALADGASPDGVALFDTLRSPLARGVFAAHGFTPL